ncbi:LysR family transcriptional regulator [Trinickia symbiotica]|uniref:Chromosome replication initiation inhibitor protein n=1 Tax=Trinickia symbiotica TaxID=863227 RepID=A0A2N7WPL2_9BURK|nr:HTH-type transcriptional regulator ArgP [Trinickia symbiotica]PMS31291.1 chromosome replication initiation inhibitor protein [Trinickia symbiotica]PPK41678.1 LysR family transcriptional regulator [Trinickia symbiotica]
MNFDPQQLQTFAVVVETGNYARAASILNISRAAVSQRIISLEERFGTPLLVRKGMMLTPSGERLLEHVQKQKLLEADTLERIKPGAGSRARLGIAVNADSLATWFGPVACAIAKENVALEVIVDDQDHTLAVLARGEAMGCVSTARVAPIGFIAEPIGAMEYECVATPSFARLNFLHGMTLRDILAAPAVLFNKKDALHAMFLEQLLGFPVTGYATHYFPSPDALLTAILAGVGYGLVPTFQIGPLIQSGDLVPLAPNHRVSVKLYWHHWKSAPPNAQMISDVVMRQARQVLIQ